MSLMNVISIFFIDPSNMIWVKIFLPLANLNKTSVWQDFFCQFILRYISTKRMSCQTQLLFRLHQKSPNLKSYNILRKQIISYLIIFLNQRYGWVWRMQMQSLLPTLFLIPWNELLLNLEKTPIFLVVSSFYKNLQELFHHVRCLEILLNGTQYSSPDSHHTHALKRRKILKLLLKFKYHYWIVF